MSVNMTNNTNQINPIVSEEQPIICQICNFVQLHHDLERLALVNANANANELLLEVFYCMITTLEKVIIHSEIARQFNI